MPWTVSRSDECPASRPWAVIKDDDGSIEGCHATEADAQAQLVALNIAESEGRAYEDINFKPPEGVATEAQRGLDWRREYGRGGTEIGIARARDLAGRRNVSPETARRMKAYFDRHEVDKEGEGWDRGSDGYPSNGRIAWALWGGDAGRSWANQLVRRMNAEDEDRSISMDIERRFVIAEAEDDLILEDRANGQTAIVGYAAVYNRLSVDLGGFREEILPGAFDRILNRQRGKADVLALVNHDSGQILGRTSSGTLELSSTEKGLRYVVTPPDTQVGRDTVSLLRRGDLRSSSFAFTVSKAGESFRTSEDGRTIRQIREVSGLYDVSVVTTPAYPDSSAAVSMRSCDCEVARRSYQAWLAEQQQPEKVAVRSVMSGVAAGVASLLRLKLHG